MFMHIKPNPVKASEHEQSANGANVRVWIFSKKCERCRHIDNLFFIQNFYFCII